MAVKDTHLVDDNIIQVLQLALKIETERNNSLKIILYK